MKRKVLAVTGTRAEYGAMRPVYAAVAAATDLELALIGQHAQLAKQSRTSTESARTK